MIFGFTGSSEVITWDQQLTLIRLFRELPLTVLHHGDCVVADAWAHNVALIQRPNPNIIIHPPTDPKLRAFCSGATEVLAPKPYLIRNRDIVRAQDGLIACPQESAEIPRSGTWATVRYARAEQKHGKRRYDIYIVWPDGTYRVETNAHLYHNSGVSL